MKTLNIEREVTIKAPVNEVFPLACPVREYDWIPGWKCNLIYCPNGRNEKDVVFKEKMTSPFLLKKAGGKTTWLTLLYDKSTYRVHFSWTNRVSTSIFRMEMSPIGSSQTRCTLSLELKTRDERGPKVLTADSEYKIGFLIEGLAAMLKHYCETGEKLNSRGSRRKTEFTEKLTALEKLTFLLNKMNMKLTRDRDKICYLSLGRISSKTLQKPKIYT